MQASIVLLLALAAIGSFHLSEAGRRRGFSGRTLIGVTCPELTFESVCTNVSPAFHFSNGCARCRCSAGADACSVACPQPETPGKLKRCRKLFKAVRKMKRHSVKKSKGLKAFGLTCPNITAAALCTQNSVGFRYSDGCQFCNCTGPAAASCKPASQQECVAPTTAPQQRKCRSLTRKTKRRLQKSRSSRLTCDTFARKYCRVRPGAQNFLAGCRRCSCNERRVGDCQEVGPCDFFGTLADEREECRKVFFNSMRDGAVAGRRRRGRRERS